MKNIYHPSLTESEAAVWSAAFVVVGTLVTVINILTLFTFINTPTLRVRKHVIIINLTVADLLFGAAGMPSIVFFLLRPSEISFFLYQIINRYTKMASLCTIGAIAVERMHAIIYPIRHRVLRNSVYKITLVFIWSFAAITTTITLFYVIGIWDNVLISLALRLTFALAVISIIVSCYMAIWISFRRRSRLQLGMSTNHEQDKALAVTLLIVTGAFIIMWLPPTIYVSIALACEKCTKSNENMITLGFLLLGIQSLSNPIIYCFRLSGFKVGLKAVVKRIVLLRNCSPRQVQARRTTFHLEEQVA